MAKKTKLSRGAKTIAWRMAKEKATVDEISDKIDVVCSMIWPYLIQRFRDVAIDLWAKSIKEEANGLCEICGKPGTEAHHLITKGSHSQLALEKMNGLYVCGNHHMFDREIAGHGSTHVCENLIEWLEENKFLQWNWYIEHKHDKAYQDIDFEVEYWKLKELL